ncbi:MAG: flagellar hook-length control protein FliK [Lachnospiraceae bacterium]|nr:flagellar hook-length control protein FliK [Lachnospiraceae bacterium]
MQTQQIFGVSGGGMMFSAKSASVKSNDSSFDQLIQMSQNIGAENGQNSQPAEIKKASAATVDKAEQPAKPTEVSTEKKDNLQTAEEKPELAKAKVTEEADDVEAAERAAGILNQVAEAVKELLGISDEELNQMLEQLGITNLQLIQPETLQNLVLMANSEQDAVVLLTDAELLNTVNELTAQVEQILQEAGITTEELLMAFEDSDFAGMIEDALNQLAETEEDEQEEVSTMVENEISVSFEENTEEDATVRIEDKNTENSAKDRNTDDSTEVDNFTEQFVNNLQKAAQKIGEITGQKDIVQMVREVADQILEKIKVSVTAETTSLEIVLTPEKLGKVNLTVSADADGTMKAKFITENELAREAIERNLVQFKEMLQEQGLKVDTIEVTVGNFEFDKNGQANESSQEEQKNGNRRFINEEELSQNEDNDQLAKILMEGGESTVNYMA